MVSGPSTTNTLGEMPSKQHDDVGRHGAEKQIDRMEARRRDPFQFLGRVVHRVVLPHRSAVEKPVRPIQDDVFADQEDDHLNGERQRGKRAVAVIVEGDQAVRGGDSEQQRGADDEHADAQIARDDRNEEPVAQVGDEIALVPPRPAGIASPERGEHREDGRERQRDRNVLHERLTETDQDGEQLLRHIGKPARDSIRECMDAPC